MPKRFFTVKEANELIPFLTKTLRRIRSVYGELQNTLNLCAPSLQDVNSVGGMYVDPRHFDLLCQLQTAASDIGKEGCHIKDLEKGLVDFPTIWEGREVYLCWKLGETEVGFWHDIDAGYAGRQPLKTAPKAATKSGDETDLG